MNKKSNKLDVIETKGGAFAFMPIDTCFLWKGTSGKTENISHGYLNDYEYACRSNLDVDIFYSNHKDSFFINGSEYGLIKYLSDKDMFLFFPSSVEVDIIDEDEYVKSYNEIVWSQYSSVKIRVDYSKYNLFDSAMSGESLMDSDVFISFLFRCSFVEMRYLIVSLVSGGHELMSGLAIKLIGIP